MNQFGQDVLSGLSSTPKKLSSKYFYDVKGDELFQQIMHLEEYYLTRAELEIFQTQKEKILQLLRPNGPFKLLELGAGDGLKTKVLLKYFVEQNVDFSYIPVDISSNVLDLLESNLRKEIRELKIQPLAGDYFKVLSDLKFKDNSRKVVFFLGSNIGNFLGNAVKSFFKSIHDNLQKGDILMIGIDLKKEPQKVLTAYNDQEGVTRAFNLNMLTRINNELGGNFDPDSFMHYPVYDPLTGECRSYLLSTKKQEVCIASLQQSFEFDAWEPIFVEVSKKYSLHEIEQLAVETGFHVIDNVYDKKGLFTDTIWEVR